MTVFSLLLTGEQAEPIQQFIEGKGCRVECRPAETQTEAQHEERRKLLGKGQEDVVWPSVACPSCFWFDPTQEDPCGFLGWPEEMVKEALRSHAKALSDADACPLKSE
jgi:hypothetical protein